MSKKNIDLEFRDTFIQSELADCWQDLERRSDCSIFSSWHWIGPWIASARGEFYLLIARCHGRVVGLGVFGFATPRHPYRVRATPTIYLSQSGDPAQDVVTIEYNEILSDREYAAEVRRACLCHLLAWRRLPDGRSIRAMAWNGAVEAEFVELAAGSKAPWRVVAEAPSSFVDLATIRGSDRAFLGHVSANTRRQVRRAMALYEQHHGPLRLDAAGKVDEALAFFHAAGALHQARWQPRGKPGAFAYPFYVRFHERLIAEGLRKGVVELVRVSAGEMPIGYLYNFLYRGRVYYYFSGFRYEADNRLKPGLVSHVLCIEHHLARGMEAYDFMAGDNRYKTSLGQPGPRMIGVIFEQPTPMLRLESWLRTLKRTRLGTAR